MKYYDFDHGYPSNQRPPSRRRVRRKGIKIIGFFLLACVILPFIILQYFLHKDKFTPRGETLSMTTSAPSIPPIFARAPSVALQKIVNDSLQGTKGRYSVYIKNLKTDEFYTYKENEQYQAGSLYKLWVMGTTMNQLQAGKIKGDTVLSMDVEELNKRFDLASESAEMHEGKVTFSVDQALQKMITISHNYAALILAQKVTLTNVTSFLSAHQFTHSKIGQPPKTTAEDIEKFFEDLYDGKLADEKHTQNMIDLLKAQRLNNKLPKYLPDEAVIAHKTGELGYVSHDAGIVYTDKGDYIIVVLSESTNPRSAEERIAEISKGVYEYFNK